MGLFLSLIRLCLFAVAFAGVCCLLNRYWKLPAAFVPVTVCCLAGCIILLAGILNLMRVFVPLFVLSGLYGFFYDLVRGGRLKWMRDPAVLLLLFASVYFYIYFYGRYISAGDDFNNWAIVVRVMLRYHRLPRFTDTVILFPSYPAGSASFIYLVCSILGSDSGGTLLFAQAFLLICCVLPLFALVERNRIASYCVIIVTLLVGLTLNGGAPIQTLYVDTLLALVCLAGFAIGYYYRDSILQKWPLLALFGSYLAVIKGSGLYFSLVLAALGAVCIWKCPDRRKKWRCILALVAIPACLLLLWNRHADLAFENGLLTRHSTSLRYMLNLAFRKGGESYAATLRAFAETLTNPREMRASIATLALSAGLALVGRLTKRRLRFPAGALLLSSWIIYLTYLTGLLGMYLFNLPEDSIEAFSRYMFTCLILLVGMASVYLIELINVLPECPVRTRAFSLGAAGAMLLAFCLAVQLPVGALTRGPNEQEINAKEMTALMPAHDKETRYLVYIWDGHREQNYGHRMVHYTAYPAQSDIVSPEDGGIAMLDDWTQHYDYFIAFWTDDAYTEYALAHGLDPAVKLWTPAAYEAAWKPA